MALSKRATGGKMKRLPLALLVLAALMGDPSSASACSCDVPAIDKLIAQADVIFSGPVTRMEVTETTGVLRVTVYVRETLKGQANSNFTIYNLADTASCRGYDFRVGREYVVFAMVNDKKSFQIPAAPRTGHLVSLCGGTAELNDPLGRGRRRLYEVKQRLKSRG
jgi:hypothetical protein